MFNYLQTCHGSRSIWPVGKDASRLRQRLLALEEEHARRLHLVLREQGPFIRGSVGTRARVCGHDGCRCAQGQLHESKYLSATVGGATRQVHLPAADEIEVSQAVERHQHWRKLRAQLTSLNAQQMTVLTELGEVLQKPYPPDNPIPPAAKRGRKPKQDKNAGT